MNLLYGAASYQLLGEMNVRQYEQLVLHVSYPCDRGSKNVVLVEAEK